MGILGGALLVGREPFTLHALTFRRHLLEPLLLQQILERIRPRLRRGTRFRIPVPSVFTFQKNAGQQEKALAITACVAATTERPCLDALCSLRGPHWLRSVASRL
jgi:hypothetical protein